MRTSSTRLRFGAALAVTTLGLFSLGGSAFAGEKGQGPEHRNERAGAGKTEVPTEVTDDDDSVTPDPDGDADNAHPSGKDRHEDKGTQGKSTSDPDDDGRGPDRSNGGPDKPFAVEDGSGGVDQGDQDGNNGCGNDDDFEDDNEGWCGTNPKRANTPPPVTPPVVVDEDDDGETVIDDDTTVTVDDTAPGAVLGNQLQNEAPAAVETKVLGVSIERAAPAAGPTETQVLGASVERGGVLARTGFGTTSLALLGTTLLLAGLGLTRKPKGEHFA